jgi:hypothetical protein
MELRPCVACEHGQLELNSSHVIPGYVLRLQQWHCSLGTSTTTEQQCTASKNNHVEFRIKKVSLA